MYLSCSYGCYDRSVYDADASIAFEEGEFGAVSVRVPGRLDLTDCFVTSYCEDLWKHFLLVCAAFCGACLDSDEYSSCDSSGSGWTMHDLVR